MPIVRPRITDFHGIFKAQEKIDFAIQFLEEDLPLFVDPFLLWKSPSQQDQALHSILINSFNHLNFLIKKGKEAEATSTLIEISECSEVGLGVSRTREGKRISEAQAKEILSLFKDIPSYCQFGFQHFEAIQLYVSGISKDRVSDIACNYLKSFLIDYTIDQCTELAIPMDEVVLDSFYNTKANKIEKTVKFTLPINPVSKKPLIFTPKRWLRFNPFINFEDYFKSYCPKDEAHNTALQEDRVKVLNYNRENYGVVEEYIKAKQRTQEDCKNDPLFSQIPILSAKRKALELSKLKSGKEDGSDWRYEDICGDLMASLFYPNLDFAQIQSRTDSNRQIRDLIFYNNRDVDFLNDIFLEFGAKQIVFEMKNVNKIERDHINQLNRYLHEGIGNFGVFLTRNPLPKAMFSNTIDLWSSQRKCLISITDEDIKLMVDVFESKQRSPIDVLKKKYLEFRRACPT